MKRFHTHKKPKNAHKRTKAKTAVLNALKKHLGGRKSFIRLYVLLCFLCAFYAFLCVKQKRQHFYGHEKKLLVCCFGLFGLFMLFILFMLFVCVKSFRLENKTALIPSFILLLTFRIHREQEEGEGYLFNPSLSLPPVS